MSGASASVWAEQRQMIVGGAANRCRAGDGRGGKRDRSQRPPPELSSAGRLAEGLRPLLRDVGEYSRVLLPGYRLRDYQIGPARAIAESITGRLGRQFAVVFSPAGGQRRDCWPS